MWLE